MSQKLISVIMTAYNEKTKELKEAVNSILDQTYSNLELIIILDNPDNEDLKKNIEDLASVDQRIKFYVNEHNLGLAASLNKAISLTKGHYIARMDSDDISLNDRLATEMEALEENNCDVITSSAIFIDEDNKIIGSHDPILTSPERIAKLLPFGCNLVHPSAFFRGSVLRELGYHTYPTTEDYDLWLRTLNNGYSIGGINSELIKYRVRSNSLTQTNKLRMFLTDQYIQEKYRAKTIDQFDESDYYHYLSSHGDNDKMRQEFSDVVNGFSQALKDVRKFKFGALKNLTPLLKRKIYRDYFKSSRQYKKEYRKLISEEHDLS